MIDNSIDKIRLEQLIAEEYTKSSSVHKIQPKVSVSLLAYNHGPFIAQALDSILSQQVNFDYEIVIGEDCSQDNTREIVLNYQRNNPDKIRIFLSKEPLNDGKSGRLNFVRNLKACRGEYVALIDGDDYWTAPDKLQKQADFLNSHKNCAACYHDVTELHENGSQQQWPYPATKKEVYSLSDLLVGNFIPTCSVMFRSRLFADFPKWFYQVPMGDWPLHILNAHHGDIGFIDEVMAVYRVHRGGIWSSRNSIDGIYKAISAANIIKQGLSSQHKKIIEYNSVLRYLEILEIIIHENKLNGKIINQNRYSKKIANDIFAIIEKNIDFFRSINNKEGEIRVLNWLQYTIFSLANEKDLKTASLCAKKFLCTFGLRTKMARVDLLNLVLLVDFPRVHKILAAIRSTVLKKYHSWEKSKTPKSSSIS